METPRWHFRFDNFLSTLELLQEAVVTLAAVGLSDLEKEGTIQRFEICWELAWKSMRDYLTSAGAWVAAMKARNVMAHEYDCDAFEKTIFDIRDSYMPLLNALKAKLEIERATGN